LEGSYFNVHRCLSTCVLSPREETSGIPTIAGSGYPGFEAWAWQGFVAPSSTPPDIVAKLRDSYLGAIKDAEIRTKLADAGIEVLQSTPAEFADYIRNETAKWDALIKSADIHAD